MNLKPLRLVLEGIDRITAPVRRINRTIDSLTDPIRRVNRAMNVLGTEIGFGKISNATTLLYNRAMGVSDAFGRVAARAGIVGFAAGVVGKRFLDTAATFEKYGAILEVVEGSAEGARRSLAWVSDFAARTPFEIGEVTDGFVRLKAYGIDPMKGTLEAVGNAAAAMGKPLETAIEAIADAVTGENERLKEFGIKARKTGGKIVYEYSMNGKQMRKVASATNRLQIEETLRAIWNERYPGAMKRLSTTWSGMWSNLSDQVSRFMLKVMAKGPFQALQERLAGVLARIDEMAASGELDAIAERVASGFVKALKAGEDLVAWLGGFGNVAKIVGGLVGVWLVAPVFQLAAALTALLPAIWGVGVALLTTPFGLALLGVTALAGGAYLLWRSWDWISGELSLLWEDLGETWDAVVGGIGRGWDRIVEFAENALARVRSLVLGATGWMPDWLVSGMSAMGGLTGVAGNTVQAARQSVSPQINLPPVGAQPVDVGGRVEIKVDVERGTARVSRVESWNPHVDWDAGAGLTMVPGTL